MNDRLLIRNGRVADPLAGREDVRDIYVEAGCIAPSPRPLPSDARIVDATGLVVAPALWDLHVHLREPGNEAAETIESGCRAAARGGFSTVVAMPNTQPPTDTPERVRFVIDRSSAAGSARVWVAGCITKGRAGQELTDFESLREAGIVALTDDGATVGDRSLMEEAARRAARTGLLIMDHAHDPSMERHGVMHEGSMSARWGLPGIPVEAERSVVERDIRLAETTGARMHIQHVSSGAACELIRRAQTRGIPVTAEATPHHLALCDEDVDPQNANFKMNPPLRSASDRRALLDAVCDGTLSALATDHAPHTAEAKAQGFAKAPFGVVGLETAVGVTYRVLVESGRMKLLDWLRLWTVGPARILGKAPPSLQEGAPADMVLLDLEHEWTVVPEDFASRSRNTPFAGRRLRARAVATIYEGKIVWSLR